MLQNVGTLLKLAGICTTMDNGHKILVPLPLHPETLPDTEEQMEDSKRALYKIGL